MILTAKSMGRAVCQSRRQPAQRGSNHRFGLAGTPRQMTLPPSSATSRAPARSTTAPTGRPRALPSPSTKSVSTSSGVPTGRPLAKATNMTLCHRVAQPSERARETRRQQLGRDYTVSSCTGAQTAPRAGAYMLHASLHLGERGQSEGIQHVHWRRFTFAAYRSVSCFTMSHGPRTG